MEWLFTVVTTNGSDDEERDDDGRSESRGNFSEADLERSHPDVHKSMGLRSNCSSVGPGMSQRDPGCGLLVAN